MELKPIAVSMLHEDITHGKQKSCGECPAARAINRYLADKWSAELTPLNLWLLYTHEEDDGEVCFFYHDHTGDLPVGVTEFILNFDDAFHPELTNPIEFVVNIPTECLKAA